MTERQEYIVIKMHVFDAGTAAHILDLTHERMVKSGVCGKNKLESDSARRAFEAIFKALMTWHYPTDEPLEISQR